MEEKFYTPKEVSEILGVALDTVRIWLRNGTLRGIKVGPRLWRIPESALREKENKKPE